MSASATTTTSTTDSLTDAPSIRGRYAARILREVLNDRYFKRFPPPSTHNDDSGDHHDSLPSWSIPALDDRERMPRQEPPLPAGKVCIIGAGIAGLYLAMLLDQAKIPYEILEASSRIGGRVFTYEFPANDPPIQHNYYDVGAMRFPHLKTMDPLFYLIEYLNLTLQPYYLSNVTTPNLFGGDAVSASDVDAMVEPLKREIQPLIDQLSTDFEAGFQSLLKLDSFSTRQYLATQIANPMTFAQVQQLETYSSSTGLFDKAFAETVLDYYDFNVAEKWSRLEGGASVLPEAMHNKLSTNVQTNKRVTSIGQSEDGQFMHVNIDGEEEPRTYATVFNATTMGCLGRMDLSKLPLTPDQRIAVRTLSYDSACKVAIKFSRAWWVELGVEPGKGGASNTDLPIRTMVFPSWIDVSPENPAVLICSYTWAQDATRIGSLLQNGNDASANLELLTIILQNLARLFSNRIPYDQLKEMVVDHHAYAWQHDPNMAGAFALFGPGQFSNLYPAVQEPAANGRFYMIGECVSAHHSWIVGAIESATTAMYKYLLRNGQLKKMAELKMSPLGGAPGKVPDETEEDALYWQVKLSSEDNIPL